VIGPNEAITAAGWVTVVWYIRDMIAVMRTMAERTARIESKIGIGPARIVNPDRRQMAVVDLKSEPMGR
jgi:hypothetical protein